MARSLPAVLLAAWACLFAAQASATTQAVLTIDVESQAIDLPAQVDTVCADGTPCGLMAIAAAFRRHGWAGTFFLNVFEHKRWGEPAMHDIVAKLQAAGQDVALHTHPHWAYDPARVDLHQYTLAEQTRIVADGVEVLGRWTGRPVVAHRAGDYGANADTLEALRRNGIVVDSSVFWQHRHSRLDGLGFPRNLPVMRGQLLEIPVTVYERASTPALLGAFPPIVTIRKIDPNWFADRSEAEAAIDAVVAADLPYLVVFLHSFSLMLPTAPGSSPTADRHAIEMLERILDRIEQKKLNVVTMRALAATGARATERVGVADTVPRIPTSVSIPAYVYKQSRRSPGTVAAIAAVPAGCALLFLLVRRRRLSNRTARIPQTST